MTKLTITLDIDNSDTYPGEDPKQNGPEVTWKRFLDLLSIYTPSNKDLSIRDGLSDPITQDLMIGKLRIEVADPYVPQRQFGVGAVMVRPEEDSDGPTVYVRRKSGLWDGIYGDGSTTIGVYSDNNVRAALDEPSIDVAITYDPPVSGKN